MNTIHGSDKPKALPPEGTFEMTLKSLEWKQLRTASATVLTFTWPGHEDLVSYVIGSMVNVAAWRRLVGCVVNEGHLRRDDLPERTDLRQVDVCQVVQGRAIWVIREKQFKAFGFLQLILKRDSS